MHFGIIEINRDGELATKTGSVSRRGVYLDADEVWRDASSLDVIGLVADTPSTVIHDVVLPAPLKGRNLESALAYELESRLPIPMDQVFWGYRRYGRDNTRFRLFAIRKTVVDALLARVREANLSCDYFVPGQVFNDAEPMSREWLDNERNFSPAERVLRYLPSDPAVKNLSLLREAVIPADIRPVRHRRWKRLYQLLLGLLLVAAFGVLWNRYERFSEDYDTLTERRQQLEHDLEEAAATTRTLVQAKELARKITENKIGSTAVLPLLADLSERLPEYMWLAGYTQSGDMIELTIMSTKDDPDLPRTLSKSTIYQFINQRKTTRPEDQSTTFTVKLRSLLP